MRSNVQRRALLSHSGPAVSFARAGAFAHLTSRRCRSGTNSSNINHATLDASEWVADRTLSFSSAPLPPRRLSEGDDNAPVVYETLADAQDRVQYLWHREMRRRARGFNAHQRTQRQTHRNEQSQRGDSALPLSPSSYLASTTLAALHAWWLACQATVLLPHDIIRSCDDAAHFVLTLIRRVTSDGKSAGPPTPHESQAQDWRRRFQKLSDEAILAELDEWILLHAPPSSSTATETGAEAENAFLSLPRFLSLVESYLRYHKGVAWGVSGKAPPPGADRTALAAYYRRRYHLHPWEGQYCPEGHDAQIPFVHILQWMLARDTPLSSPQANGTKRQAVKARPFNSNNNNNNARAEDDEADDPTAARERARWQRFRALEPFRPHGAFAALDVGCQSGFATDLLLTAGASFVLAVDTTQTALHSTEATVHDHMHRGKGRHGRELAAENQLVQVQQCELLPAPPVRIERLESAAGATAHGLSDVAGQMDKTRTAESSTFENAARRRRLQARAQGTQYAQPHTFAAARHERESTSEHAVKTSADDEAPFDVLFFHPARESLWPVATLSELRGHGVGHIDVRMSVRGNAPSEGMDANAASLPSVLAPQPHAVDWLADPALDPLHAADPCCARQYVLWRASAAASLTAAQHAGRGASAQHASTVADLVEQLLTDVVVRSAGWPREGTASLSEREQQKQKQKVVTRERPLIREDGYIVLVLPRVMGTAGIVQVLHQHAPQGVEAVVSVADSVLAALEGVYEPILRRTYAPPAVRTTSSLASSSSERLPILAQKALDAIVQLSGGEEDTVHGESSSTPRAAMEAARLLRQVDALTNTVDVLVLRKSAEACERARAAVASLASEEAEGGVRRGRQSTDAAALALALSTYERLTSASSDAHKGDDDDDGDLSSSPWHVTWTDSFEHNECKPRTAPTTRYHWTDLVPTYSYLEPDFYDTPHQGHHASGRDSGGFGTAHSVTSNFLACGHPPSPASLINAEREQGAAWTAMSPEDMIASAARYGTAASDAHEEAPRRGGIGRDSGRHVEASRVTAVANASATFRAIFAEELRHKRRGKIRKLALSPREQQEWYVDEKLLKSEAAKVELMNELARWDLKDYD